MTYQELIIRFFENGDVYYHYQIHNFKAESFSHIIEYPIEKIELLDDYNVTPIYLTVLQNGNCVIEIKEYQEDISVQFIKKDFLKRMSEGNKTLLKYSENLEIVLLSNSDSYLLRIHSPYSYLSALKRTSIARFKDRIFSPRDFPLRVWTSGLLEINWDLEIIEEKKHEYGSNDPAHYYPRKIHNFNRKYNYSYPWLNELHDRPDTNTLVTYLIDLLRFRIHELLEGSCFYLSAFTDITPIIYFQEKIRSYIYCDEKGVHSNKRNQFNEILSELKLNLSNQGFKTVTSFNVENDVLNIQEIHFSHGYVQKMNGAEFMVLEKDNIFYTLLYINCDNSQAFNSLYVKNRIVPHAICEIFPDGGSMGKYSLVKIPYKFRMPDYYLGHVSSIGKFEDYEEMFDELDYFGIRQDTGFKPKLYIRKR